MKFASLVLVAFCLVLNAHAEDGATPAAEKTAPAAMEATKSPGETLAESSVARKADKKIQAAKGKQKT